VLKTRKAAVFCFLVITCLHFSVSLSAEAAIIPVEGEIDKFRLVFIRRSIERARSDGADPLIFSINTFGGRVDSALQIATLIGSLDDIKTVAYIPAGPEQLGVSWSAGALISFACNAIYMAPGTSIGAAAPVYQTSEGVQEAGEKTVSAVRAQLAALAEKNGYPREAAVAMVDEDIRLVEVHEEGRPRLKISNNGEDEAEKLVSPKGKLLTLTAGEMERYGISSGSPPTLEALAGELGVESYYVIDPTGADRIVGLITSAAVTSILLTIGLIALYLEITSPGFGVPGTVAIIAFSVMFISGGMLGTLGSLELLLFMCGVALLAVEIFLIPGFGITGASGLLFMGAGLILSRQSFILPEGTWQWDLFRQNLLLIFGTFAVSFLLLAVLMMFFPRIRLFSRLILSAPAGLSASSAETSASNPVPGSRGIARTALRPVGRAEIEGEEYPVQTEGEWIAACSAVVVIETRGNLTIVRSEKEAGE
jgi:membrane-bound serine protease (ClpP class)